MLDNWFHNQKEPVFVLEAIGGMGKSALCHVWLHENILERNTNIDGIIWWSFYDSPFETFLPELCHYLTSKEVTIDVFAQFGGDFGILNSILHNNNFLLILDGFERALRGYTGMNAMYIQEKGLTKKDEAEWDIRQREPVNPHAAKLLKALTSEHTKTLITTRLFPAPLEELDGVYHKKLTGLSPKDAVDFLRVEGINGIRAEMENAAAIYNNHPLMLKHLSTAIKSTREKDIQSAYKFNIINKKEPQKILQTSYELLTDNEKQVATTVAVLRSAFTFEAASALFTELNEDKLWRYLCHLQNLGFIFYDENNCIFDFHPIMRSFLYDNLTAGETVHERAVEYFKAIPEPEKIIKLDDLAPVIELYHHLVRAGKYDEARELFTDRISEASYYQLSAYNLRIELLKELFPDGEDKLPRLKNRGAQAWLLNALANSYALSGQPIKAIPLYLLHNKLQEEDDNLNNLAIGLGNVAHMAQINIDQLSAAAIHLNKRVLICRENKEEYRVSIGHRELGRLSIYQGKTEYIHELNLRTIDNNNTAEKELEKATAYFEKTSNYQSLSIVLSYRSFSALLSAGLINILPGSENTHTNSNHKALEYAYRALEFAEKDAFTSYPMPRDFIRAYWLLGEALIQCYKDESLFKTLNYSINFYDVHFQQIQESVIVNPETVLKAAGRCITEALQRCRKVNLVESEPDILLANARLLWVKNTKENKITESLAPIEELLKEAQEIAERAGYRLKLAGIHLFCGEVLLETSGEKLLKLSARDHLQKAKEYAKDVSTIEDLFQSEDPNFYDGIPEYEMLKRGMTEQERIDNGYWIAYKIAEELEKRL